jgi:hypothetical protein
VGTTEVIGKTAFETRSIVRVITISDATLSKFYFDLLICCIE